MLLGGCAQQPWVMMGCGVRVALGDGEESTEAGGATVQGDGC